MPSHPIPLPPLAFRPSFPHPRTIHTHTPLARGAKKTKLFTEYVRSFFAKKTLSGAGIKSLTFVLRCVCVCGRNYYCSQLRVRVRTCVCTRARVRVCVVETTIGYVLCIKNNNRISFAHHTNTGFRARTTRTHTHTPHHTHSLFPDIKDENVADIFLKLSEEGTRARVREWPT